MPRKSELETYIKQTRAKLHAELSVIIRKSPELFEKGATEHAVGCLDELIDDLFHTPLASAEQGDRENGSDDE